MKDSGMIPFQVPAYFCIGITHGTGILGKDHSQIYQRTATATAFQTHWFGYPDI